VNRNHEMNGRTSSRLMSIAGRLIFWPAVLTLVSVGSAFGSDWWDNVSIYGDFRYRHEYQNEEGEPERNRQRIRARIGITGKVNDNMKTVFQLATGGDNPVSTNQSLDDAFSTKPIGVDLAYMEFWHDRLPGVTVQAGKFKNPFYKPGGSELIWDSDWNPEGGVVKYDRDFQHVSVELIGAELYVEERSTEPDALIGAGQGVLRLHVNDKRTAIAVGGSIFGYSHTEGFDPFFNASEPLGNSMDTLGHYANGFNLVEANVELTHALNGTPLNVHGDFVKNTSADSLDTGWLVGFNVGKAKDPGSWEFRYIYRELEKDAVVGQFTDSDFRGGGTDGRGHELGGAYQLMKNAAFKVTYFINETDLEAEKQMDYKKLQVDLQLKFK
jgi:hypothetical protein